MATRCFKPFKGTMLRLTALDSCGNYPADGTANSVVVTNGFISVTLSAEVEDGNEIIVKRADGVLCVNEKDAPNFKRMNVEVQLCGVDPGALSLMSNAEAYQDYAGNDAGIVIGEGEFSNLYSLELWTGTTGSDLCSTGAAQASGYILLPKVQSGVPGDITIDNENALNMTITGSYTKGGNQWGQGPYNVLDNAGTLSPLPTSLDTADHFLFMETTMPLPESQCGLQPFTLEATPQNP